MKSVILAATISLVLGGQAQALSCMRPDVARTFDWASEANESYIILQGTFAFTQPARPNTSNVAPTSVRLPATFNGRYLGADGFVDAPILDVTLEFSCVSAWCGSIQNGDDVIAFVQQSDSGYMLRVDACHSTVFNPTDDTLQRVTSCMRGTGCDTVQ
ncbi:hypothetical protein [Yoonia sp.]|uniref:hypothetical protein n=1 Tax=Yoonia sp. TaxID=2212373 RepID=UPI003F4AED15